MLKLLLLFAALSLPFTVHADSADTLVDLVRPHAREVQRLTFLSKIDLFGSATVAAKECDMSRTLDTLRTLYAQQYRQGLSTAERASAIEFFGSELGQLTVQHRLHREIRLFDTVLAKQTVSKEEPEYPPPLADALGAFLKSGAGSKFVDDRVEKETQPGASAIKDFGSDALVKCLTASRPLTRPPAQATERPTEPRVMLDQVSFVLETAPAKDQIGFSVDVYPNTPTCETQPIPAVRQSFPQGTQPPALRIEVQPSKPLSFFARATYADGTSCSPGAMTFNPQQGGEYTARLLHEGNKCFVELSVRDPDGRLRRIGVEPKPLKVDSGGRRSCDWVVP